MELWALEELAAPDPRVVDATPLARDAGTDRAAQAAERIQQMVLEADLIPSVPEPLRRSYERLRTLHAYGVLCYDLFTIVCGQALLVLEQALAARFTQFYGGRITLIRSSSNEEVTIEFQNLHDLHLVLAREYRSWRLKTRSGGPLLFTGGMTSLLRWARHEGLLSGQRNRHYERATSRMRNHLAHPEGYWLTWEFDSAREIWNVAEMINVLWGGRARPNGRYSRVVEREVMAIGRSADGESVGKAEGIPYWRTDPEERVVLVLASPDDPWLLNFSPEYELTYFPAELLWGPGSVDEAIEWLRAARPQPDHAEYLDRLFALRVNGDDVDPPRSLEAVAALAGEDGEEWILVRADTPGDAFQHVRNSRVSGSPCAHLGPCPHCAAESIVVGQREQILKKAARLVGHPIVARSFVTSWTRRGTWGASFG